VLEVINLLFTACKYDSYDTPNFLFIVDKNELKRLADIDIAYQLDEFFFLIVQPHKYRKKG